MHRFIITGGPGAGKTSLLTTLQGYGYLCSAEVSRELIMEELANGSGCLPWLDLPCFADKALERMIGSYHAAAHLAKTGEQHKAADKGPVFFDRGIPDIIAYLRVAGLSVPQKYPEAVQMHPYHKTVFLLPPWKDIYVQDNARWQSFEEAAAICRSIEETYRSAGYGIITLPEGTPDQRAQFVQAYISGTSDNLNDSKDNSKANLNR